MIYTFEGETPKIANDIFVAPNASIIGNVEIAEKASVWFGVVIRGDNDLKQMHQPGVAQRYHFDSHPLGRS